MAKAMRQIKFKAKRKDNGKWVYGDIFHMSDGNIIMMVKAGEHYTIEPGTVCQFTGVEDKKGTPIYEGDEVEYDNGEISFIRTIEWRKGAFRFGDNLWRLFEENHLKVLGSKFDKEMRNE